MSPILGEAWIHQQLLRHPFGTSRGIDAMIPTVLVRTHDGALGEGSPVRYLNQSSHQVCEDVMVLLGGLGDTDDLSGQLHAIRTSPACSAARCAVDIAMHDRHARRADLPLHEFLGLRAPVARQSSLTIGLDSAMKMEAKAREVADWPILKVKLGRGSGFDTEALYRVRSAAPKARLTVDANAGWTVSDAEAMFPILVECGVELLEQPTRIGALDDLSRVTGECPIPVVADEDAQGPGDLPALIGRVRGINIKLMKCGGIGPALEMFTFAREHGWLVLLGCMVETGIGIAAATHLASQADWLDLDGALLSKNDPASTAVTSAAPWCMMVSEAPGLGVQMSDPIPHT